jgi:hypothetical protein
LLHRHGARYPTSWCKWTISRIFEMIPSFLLTVK